MARLGKAKLFARILSPIEAAGWSVNVSSPPKEHPLRFTMNNGQRTYNVRAYIWNLTHGGGAKRPRHALADGNFLDRRMIKFFGFGRFGFARVLAREVEEALEELLPAGLALFKRGLVELQRLDPRRQVQPMRLGDALAGVEPVPHHGKLAC